MRIPHSSSAWGSRFDIPFHHNRPGYRTPCLEHQLRDFCCARLTWISHSEHRSWIELVSEIWPRCHYQWVNLTSDFKIYGDLNGITDDICAMIKICNQACLISSIQKGLDRKGIVWLTR